MKSWLIHGHRGGVGRSTFTLELAASIAKTKRDVLVIDADPARPIARRLGLQLDALDERSRIFGRLQVLPRGSIADVPELLSGTASTFDVVLVDAPAGAAEGCLELCSAVDEVLVHLRADPLSWRSLPASLARLEEKLDGAPDTQLRGFAVGAPPGEAAEGEWMTAIIDRLGERCLGPALPWSSVVTEAEMNQRPVQVADPKGEYTRVCKELAERLLDSGKG